MKSSKKATPLAPPTQTEQSVSTEDTAVVETELGQCPVKADDNEQCIRPPHPNDPNAHEFGRRSVGSPVDGGRRWSHWIRLVNTMRNVLIGHEYSLIGADGQKLAQLANILELHSIPSDIEGKAILTDDSQATWRMYKEAKN